MKILILVGSASQNSHSLGLGRSIQNGLQGRGVEAELIDLITYSLPGFDREVDKAKTHDEKTAQFIAKSHEADGFVWVTPVYHNSFSATLKNALDWQHFSLDGKTVGFASNGGNRAPVALDQLSVVARSQHLISSPSRVCTSAEDYDDDMNITPEDIVNRIGVFCDDLVRLTLKIAS